MAFLILWIFIFYTFDFKNYKHSNKLSYQMLFDVDGVQKCKGCTLIKVKRSGNWWWIKA